jgi:hypothetical protein
VVDAVPGELLAQFFEGRTLGEGEFVEPAFQDVAGVLGPGEPGLEVGDLPAELGLGGGQLAAVLEGRGLLCSAPALPAKARSRSASTFWMYSKRTSAVVFHRFAVSAAWDARSFHSPMLFQLSAATCFAMSHSFTRARNAAASSL